MLIYKALLCSLSTKFAKFNPSNCVKNSKIYALIPSLISNLGCFYIKHCSGLNKLKKGICVSTLALKSAY